MKKLVSFLMAVVLIVRMMPMVGLAAENATEFITLEVSVDTTIREEEFQDAKALSKVKQGGYLISTGSVTNCYGNVWFRVIDVTSGKEGFVYSGKVQEHLCSYQNVDGSDYLIFCKCGNVQMKESDTLQIYNAAALPLSVIDPGVIVALGGMGAAVGSAVAAALPYLAVGSAFGIVIYILLNVTDNSVSVEEISTDWRRLDANYKPDEGLYYNGMMENNFFFIDIAKPMDIYEAIEVIESSIQVHKTLSFVKRPFYWFVYTLTDLSALCLVEDFVSSHPGYTSSYVEDAHSKGDLMHQYKHYHIVKKINPVGSHLGGHILFGAPMLDAFNDGMWA